MIQIIPHQNKQVINMEGHEFALYSYNTKLNMDGPKSKLMKPG